MLPFIFSHPRMPPTCKSSMKHWWILTWANFSLFCCSVLTSAPILAVVRPSSEPITSRDTRPPIVGRRVSGDQTNHVWFSYAFVDIVYYQRVCKDFLSCAVMSIVVITFSHLLSCLIGLSWLVFSTVPVWFSELISVNIQLSTIWLTCFDSEKKRPLPHTIEIIFRCTDYV